MFANANLTATWGRAFGLDLVDVYDRNREDPHVYDMLIGDEEITIGIPGMGRFHLGHSDVFGAVGETLSIEAIAAEVPLTSCVRNRLHTWLDLRAWREDWA